jgi:hypothetical protein
MRMILASSLAALALGAATGSLSAASPAAGAGALTTTLSFDVAFSPFTLAATNNDRDPNSPFAIGDETLFHDTLLSGGKRVGDEVGSCVIVSTSPEILANCSMVIRLPHGTITGQFATSPGPAPKPLALTGGTGSYRNIGGQGTLVEFGNSTGTLTLRVLSFEARGRG